MEEHTNQNKYNIKNIQYKLKKKNMLNICLYSEIKLIS